MCGAAAGHRLVQGVPAEPSRPPSVELAGARVLHPGVAAFLMGAGRVGGAGGTSIGDGHPSNREVAGSPRLASWAGMCSAEYDEDIAATASDERMKAMSDRVEPDDCAEDFGLIVADCAQSAVRPGDGMGAPLATGRLPLRRRSRPWGGRAIGARMSGGTRRAARARNARRRSASPASSTSSWTVALSTRPLRHTAPGAASSHGSRKRRRRGPGARPPPIRNSAAAPSDSRVATDSIAASAIVAIAGCSPRTAAGTRGLSEVMIAVDPAD